VSWDEVQVFIQRLNQKTGGNYRLPTEAEWEYAARGGSRQIDNPSLYSGSSSLDQVGWSSENSEGQVHPVGMKSPNALGLYDMSGNVWEWCSDYYGMYSDKVQNNPTGAKKGVAKVARGGCYSALSNMCRVTVRKSIFQDSGDEIVGFRLAMSDDREAQAADAAKRAEQERIAAEKAAADEAKRAEMDRAAAEKEAADAAKRAEMDRVAAEKAAAEEAKRAEQDRIAAEKAAADAAKRAEQDRIAAEKIVMHMEKATRRQEKLSSLQPSVFLTLNTAFTSMPQWSYGFKVGTVRVVGWYFSAMSNFNMRGAFNKFDNHHYYELTGKSKTSYLEGQIGLVVRPCKVLSLHLGAGFGYRTYNLETNQGWRNLTTRCYYGPTASLGVMFHIKCVVLSAEVTGMVYNFNTRNDVMNSLGAKVGVGFCLPYQR
jgi:hypothetical protein